MVDFPHEKVFNIFIIYVIDFKHMVCDWKVHHSYFNNIFQKYS